MTTLHQSNSILLRINDNTLSIQTMRIEGPEDLRECIRGSDVDIVQLKEGRLKGSLTHVGVGNLSMSLGRFNLELRARGPISQDKVTIGMLLDSVGPTLQWWQEVVPGDLLLLPAGAEADSIYSGAASYATISLSPFDLTAMVGGEVRNYLTDSAFWNRRSVRRADPRIHQRVKRRLAEMMSNFECMAIGASVQTTDFLRREIIEDFLATFIDSSPPGRNSSRLTAARLVYEVENYVDAAGGRPIHISELCNILNVSRRSLQRAFTETLNMGPITYLRRRRLSAAREILKRSDPSTVRIAQVALEHGFQEPGRFAVYYRSLFGESPSETLRGGRIGAICIA